MNIYENIIDPILDNMDSERAHVAAREMIHSFEAFPFTLKILERIANRGPRFQDKRLNVVLGGMSFENPLLVGAGWDKAGRAVRGLHAMGFAGVEVGSVLALPQEGNPKPKQWYRGEGVALNRLGFNSPGVMKTAENLLRYKDDGIPIGISIGVNKHHVQNGANIDEIFRWQAAVAAIMKPFVSYFTLNYSSPNTLGLRNLQGKDFFKYSVQNISAVAEDIPVCVKVDGDSDNSLIDDVITVALEEKIAALIACNTTVNAGIKSKYGWEDQMGGVSGNDLDYQRMVNERIGYIYRQTRGELGIMGVGGINDTYTALDKIEEGASVLQIVTGIRQVGPSIASDINKGLVDWMEANGVESIQDVIGDKHSNLTEV